MSEESYGEMSLVQLITASRPYDANDSRYAQFRAEFERRQTIAIVEAATARNPIKSVATWCNGRNVFNCYRHCICAVAIALLLKLSHYQNGTICGTVTAA